MDVSTMYEHNQKELREATRHEQQVDAAPLPEREEAQQSFFEIMRDRPGIVGEKIGQLIDGKYGHGAMLKAKQIVVHPRTIRETVLIQLVAVFAWSCPRRMATDAWKKLTQSQKKLLDDVVDAVVARTEKGKQP
jgi:hypothetical protein